MGWYYYDFYPKSKPREAKGGIKAQSKRGTFGQSWWAKRWIAVLEGFNIGARLDRGRSYARKGQVLSINIDQGKVTADVQGSRPKPYRVSIEVTQIPAKDWDRVIDKLSGEAIFAAKLLSGEMPEDIEKMFNEAGVPLFPTRRTDLVTNCSCPDWSNPCKHIAAVYYLIGEEFDRDPFLIFKLRGLDRDQLTKQLGEQAAPVEAEAEELEPAATAEPLPNDPATFWAGGELPDDLIGDVDPPSAPAAVLRRLGGFPFWRGNEPLIDALTPVYRGASERGRRWVEDEATAGE